MNAELSIASLLELMRQETLQSVVHDLRTPITVLKGNLELLRSGLIGQLTPDQKKLVDRSIGPLDELILMTENLLQMAQLEDHQVELHLEETDLDRLLSETLDFYQIPFEQRHMKLYREGNTLGMRLLIDAFWIKRVLQNLIWNAFKFTPDGGRVTVHVSHVEGGLTVTVEDTGLGIAEDKLQTIFGKFKQAHGPRDRKIGTGLGLWICQQVMALHGGHIRVESTPDEGSRFILFFPSNKIL